MSDEEKTLVPLDQVNELIASVDKKLDILAPKPLSEEEMAKQAAAEEERIAKAARKALDERDQEQSIAQKAQERINTLRDDVIKTAKLDKENFDEEFFQDMISIEVSKARAQAENQGKQVSWKEVVDKITSKYKKINRVSDEESEETEDSEDDTDGESQKKKGFGSFGFTKDEVSREIKSDTNKLEKLYSEAKKYESEGKKIPTEIVRNLVKVREQIQQKANSLPKEQRDKFWSLYPHE